MLVNHGPKSVYIYMHLKILYVGIYTKRATRPNMAISVSLEYSYLNAV